MSPISGNQTRRHWAAASRATRRSRSTVACPRAPLQRTTLRSLTSGTMRSMPSSVSFWTTHSGRSPLIGAKATVRAGVAAGSDCTVPSPPMPEAPVDGRQLGVALPGDPGPVAAPVGGDDLLAGSQAEHPAQVVGVLVGQRPARAGSSTKTCAAAAARTAMAA